jgi:diaminopimelate decarboxylase
MPTTRATYERPLLATRALLSATKQWGDDQYARPVDIQRAIDGIPVQAIRARFGSPLYVVSEAALRRNYRAMLAAFRSRYPDTVIAYSYKTNYVSGILRVFHQEGAHAEVVSHFELELARSLGVVGEHIVYNGPHKPIEALKTALAIGARINVDSLEELSDLQELARAAGRKAKIGLRVNMRLNDPPWDRFGFNLESGQALEACRRIHASSHLSLAGFHCHAGTFLTQVDLYARAIAGLLLLAKTVEANGCGPIEYLDLGGGYASRNTLQGQLLPGDLTNPGHDQYAEAMCDALKAGLRGLKRRPTLVLEPGRALVDDPVSLLVSVVSVKTLLGGRKGIVVDGGVNLLSTAHYFRHAVNVTEEYEGAVETADLLGPLCMQIDVLGRDIPLPPVQRGAILLIKHAGAYTISSSTQFIYPRPPVVMITNGEMHLLRRGERWEDLVRLDEIPAHLRAARPPAARASRNGHGR